MQVIIDEIVNNVRMVDRSASALTPEVMRKIIGACLDAVRDMTAKEQRVKEEQSIDGPWSTQPHAAPPPKLGDAPTEVVQQ